MSAIVLLPLAAIDVAAQTPQSLGCNLESGPSRTVVAVIDGDTVRLDDGKIVRLLDILAPKARDIGSDKRHWPAADAARNALAAEIQNRTIMLAFTGARTDRHNHVLAHLFSAVAGETRWLQRSLVEAGQARVFSSPGQGTCAAHLQEAERIARVHARGLWESATYQVRPADRPSELRRFVGTFQIVAGNVHRVIHGRRLTIVELANSEARPGTGDQQGPGALRLTMQAAARASELHLSKLGAGTTIEARGWIGPGRSGPEMEILTDQDIAILKDATSDNAGGPRNSRNRAPAKRQRPEAELPGVAKE